MPTEPQPPKWQCDKPHVPNATTSQPVILSDDDLAEISARAWRQVGATRQVMLTPEERDALCQTVRTLRARIADLTAQWCECGHAKDKHGFFSDHDECYECDQSSPDLCCEWRPAPRTPDDTHTDLREQLAHQRQRITFWQRHIERMGKLLGTIAMDTEVERAVKELQSRLAEVEKDRDYWKERCFRPNKGLQP